MKYLKIIALTVVMAVMCGCVQGNGNYTSIPSNSGVNSPSVQEKKEYTGTPVTTPAGVIYIPEEWDEPIEFTEEGTNFVFTSEGYTLYQIGFSAEAEGAIGICETENGFMYVHLEVSEAENDSDDYFGKLESVNVLLEQLYIKPVSQASGMELDKGNFEIETSLGEFEFSAQWQNMLTANETADGEIEFTASVPEHEDMVLFTISKQKEGSHFSINNKVDGTELFVTIEELNFDKNWNENDKKIYPLL